MNRFQFGISTTHIVFLTTALAAVLTSVAVARGEDAGATTPVPNVSTLSSVAPTAGAKPGMSAVDPRPSRVLGSDTTVIEPDPTAFDREGLEIWWRNYLSHHPTER